MALEHRLKDRARASGQPVNRLRKLVVFERLLARFAALASGHWTLKGALSIDLRIPQRSRTTQDLDLAYRQPREVAEEILIDIQNVDVGDYFSFVLERASPDTDVPEPTVRHRVRAELAGRIFDETRLDISFAEALDWGLR